LCDYQNNKYNNKINNDNNNSNINEIKVFKNNVNAKNNTTSK